MPHRRLGLPPEQPLQTVWSVPGSASQVRAIKKSAMAIVNAVPLGRRVQFRTVVSGRRAPEQREIMIQYTVCRPGPEWKSLEHCSSNTAKTRRSDSDADAKRRGLPSGQCRPPRLRQTTPLSAGIQVVVPPPCLGRAGSQ